MAKTIYYTPKDGTGTKSYLVDDIDANDAVRRFPDEYSFDPPTKGAVTEVLTPLSAMATNQQIPMAGADQAPNSGQSDPGASSSSTV